MSRRRAGIILRPARATDARAVHALIAANVAGGHLLARALDEVSAHVTRFVVAVEGRKVIGCAELAPLGARLAEIRSLAVHERARHQRIGTQLVAALRRLAQHAGYEQLCVLTHAPEYFTALGFSIVPHLWVQEKVFTDCVHCPQFRTCGRFAMVVALDAPADHGDDDPAHTPGRTVTIALQVA